MEKNLIMFLCCLLCMACQGNKKDNAKEIAVTIEPLRYFTEQIAGCNYHIITMVPPGSNPEIYEPTSKQMVNLANCSLIIKIGELGFEKTWMNKITATAPNIKVISASKGITPVKSAYNIPDPHTWMSCTNAAIIAKNICEALKQKDPAQKQYYEKNLKKLLNKISKTEKDIRSKFAHGKKKSFLIYHPALTYFAKEYNFIQLPIEEEGREPSAAQLKNLITNAQKYGTKIMFIQKEFSNRNTSIVDNGTNTKRIEINHLSYQWHEQMLNIAKNLQ